MPGLRHPLIHDTRACGGASETHESDPMLPTRALQTTSVESVFGTNAS